MRIRPPIEPNQIIVSTKVFDTKVQKIEGTNQVIYRNKRYIQDSGEVAYQGARRIWVYRLTAIGQPNESL